MMVLIGYFKINPTLTILLAVLILALGIKTSLEEIVGTINQVFADTIKNIGLVLFLGSYLGKILEETGAAVRITKFIVRVFGREKIIYAIDFSSAIIGISLC